MAHQEILDRAKAKAKSPKTKNYVFFVSKRVVVANNVPKVNERLHLVSIEQMQHGLHMDSALHLVAGVPRVSTASVETYDEFRAIALKNPSYIEILSEPIGLVENPIRLLDEVEAPAEAVPAAEVKTPKTK